MDPLGPVCEMCQCNGHAETCHPHTGECVELRCIGDRCPECYEEEPGCGKQCVGDQCDDPDSDPQTRPGPWVVIDVVVYCQHHPDKCYIPEPSPVPGSTVIIYFITCAFIQRKIFLCNGHQQIFIFLSFFHNTAL